jgi:hypothetical protein
LRFPNALPQAPVVLPYAGGRHTPLRAGVAFVPPADTARP